MMGMLVGGIVFGILGDKKGRLKVLFGSILLYSIANILNGFVKNVDQYMFLRFIAGVGLAGELGAGVTLVSEHLPNNKRSLAAGFIAGFGVLGAVSSFSNSYRNGRLGDDVTVDDLAAFVRRWVASALT